MQGTAINQTRSATVLAVLGREISAFDVDVQRSLVTGVCQAPAPHVYRACLISHLKTGSPGYFFI